MPSKKFVVGVDGGTESLRAGVFDLQGDPLSYASSSYPTSFPHPSWAEQNPSDWWQSLGVAVRQCILDAGIAVTDVVGLCIDTTCCTVVALDEEGKALRPALLWMDMRSAQQAARVAASDDEALAVNGGGAGPVSAEWMIPKALWLRENEPEMFDRAAYICEYQDFMNYHLTGRMCASITNVSVRWHYSQQRQGGWPATLLQKLGLSALLNKWPQEVLPLGAVVGGLTTAAAQHLGLPHGTPVAQGGADAFIGMIGLGVLEAGQLALLTGSSHLHLGMTDRTLHGQGMWGTYSGAVLPGLNVVEGGQTSTGSVVAWFRRMVGLEGYQELNEEAEGLPPGCEGVVCLDHFQGNRTPHTDALSRGAITGLTLKHGRGHVFRALMESICYGTELVFETMKANGYCPISVTMAGGATLSPLWLQIHADVSNKPFVLTKVAEAPALGCAILAAVAAGLYPDIPSAARAMVAVERVVQPDSQRHLEYRRFYLDYKMLYPSLKNCFHARAQQAFLATAAASLPAAAMERWPHAGPIVAHSILSADLANLAADVNRAVAVGAAWVHVDVSDGSFMPTLTLGPPVVKSLRRHTSAFLDCHLAVLNPQNYLQDMAAAGANQFTFHLEASGIEMDTGKAVQLATDVREAGMQAGIALKPDTPVEVVLPVVEAGAVDTVLLLSARPGLGDEKFLPSVLPKVRALRCRFPSLNVQVKGGITLETASLVAGANVLVADTTGVADPPEFCVAALVSLIAAGLQQCEAEFKAQSA